MSVNLLTRVVDATSPDAERSDTPSDRHFWVFQLLFMVGFMFHGAEEWDSPHETVLTMLLIFLFVQLDRFREWTFLAFVVLLSWRNLALWPNLANHSNIILFVCLFLIPLQIRRCLRRTEDNTARTVSTLRWLVVLMYFFAAFHKINADFFNAAVSCSFARMQDYLGVAQIEVASLPAGILRGVPLSVVLMELLPPLLFVSRKTQKYGIAMLLFIHAVLAPVGFADFSSVAMALLWLFVAPDSVDRLPGRTYFTTMVAGLVFMQLFFAGTRIKAGDAVGEGYEGLILILAFTPVWFAYFRAGAPGENMRLPRTAAHGLFLAFVIFFGMNNYLGLRTAGTLSMFSNLVTEGDHANHYVLGGSSPLKVFNFQEDVVEILSVDERIRGNHRDSLVEGNSVQVIEFDRAMDRLRNGNDNDLSMVIRYRGEIYGTDDLQDDERFDFDVPWWHKKWFKFRLIQPSPPQQCLW